MNNPEKKSDALAREFASQLKKTRERQGLNQSGLARRSGLTPAAISQLESGQREPNFSTLVRLATALGTTPNDLMGIGTADNADPSVQALFREVKNLAPEDFAQVKSFAQFLAQKKK